MNDVFHIDAATCKRISHRSEYQQREDQATGEPLPKTNTLMDHRQHHHAKLDQAWP
jgi:hypothetical protein